LLIPSEHHEDHEAKREAEGFVQSALDALSAQVAILDKSGGIIGVNEAWRQFADQNGFRDSRYGIGTNYIKVCDAASASNSRDAPVIADGIRDVMQGRLNEFELEYPFHSPVEQRWFVVRVSRFKWYDDVRVIVAHQNVTELKRAQIELSESKRRIEAILNNVNNGILTIDTAGTITSTNRAATRIFGYPNDEFIGTHLSDIIDEPFDERNPFKRLNGELGHELVGKRKDGERFPVYFALNELQLDDGVLYTCIIQDITYRKRMEAEIVERERVQVALEKERELRVLKNRFLSMMGHELNTPLASISLSYDMLKKYGDVSTEEENEQALDNIQIQVGHLRDMVKDVMTLSRSESEGLEIDTRRANLITYCRDVVEEFQFGYQQTHNVLFECDEKHIDAQIDRRMLRRVFTNLLSNAIKYSPEGGDVIFRLSVDHDQDVAVIEVTDSGIGIPQADVPRLFEPFHRAGNVDALPGTGLGLPIAKQVIELHGGTIDVETEMDVGTTFRTTLPLHHKRAE
jgi:PAS domain S-box-containing protein